MLTGCYFIIETLRLHLGLNQAGPFFTGALTEYWTVLACHITRRLYIIMLLSGRSTS